MSKENISQRTTAPLYNERNKKNITNEKDYDKYRIFFEECYEKHKKEIENLNPPDLPGVPNEVIKRKVLDRALWEFGRISMAASNF